LILITDRSQAVRPLEEICSAALDAGFAAVMVREKDLDARPLLDLTEPISRLCQDRGRPLLVNERVDLALALPGAGAHVGKAGLPVAVVRELLGPDRVLGYSAHGIDEAGDALDAGADYVTLSPVFASRSKPELTPRGIDLLEQAIGVLPATRIVALGGLKRDNLASIRATGVAGAAVMGEMMRAEDPSRTAAELERAWQGD
jgi:thiamine-phosphate pyrophosphorylase